MRIRFECHHCMAIRVTCVLLHDFMFLVTLYLSSTIHPLLVVSCPPLPLQVTFLASV